jgi:hypothetical protein
MEPTQDKIIHPVVDSMVARRWYNLNALLDGAYHHFRTPDSNATLIHTGQCLLI